MDHRDIITSLPPAQRNWLLEKSDRAGLTQLAFHWGLIVLFGGLIAARIPYWPLLILPQGVLVVFLFTLLHETVHRTAFKTVWLNDVVARACGFLVVLPPDWFRYFHFAHHRFTQDPENDPELRFPKPETLRQYLVHVSGIPVWWGEIRQLVINALGRCGDTFVPAKGYLKIRREAQGMILGYAVVLGSTVYFQSAFVLYGWIIPAIVGQPFLRLYLLAEHGRCPYVANMLENTRTTLTNWLVRKIAWNMPFHTEHHSYPGVPFHRLPYFHAVVADHIKELENGYTRFNAKYVERLRVG